MSSFSGKNLSKKALLNRIFLFSDLIISDNEIYFKKYITKGFLWI